MKESPELKARLDKIFGRPKQRFNDPLFMHREAWGLTDKQLRAIHRRYDQTGNPPDDWEECGGCGGLHPPGYDGDCRDDRYRL